MHNSACIAYKQKSGSIFFKILFFLIFNFTLIYCCFKNKERLSQYTIIYYFFKFLSLFQRNKGYYPIK